MGPDLARRGGRRSFFDLAAAMWNHAPAMRRRMDARQLERVALEPWEAADLIAFMFWLDYFDPPGDTTTGAALFRRKNCVRCHQVRGMGGARGPDLGELARSRTPIMIAAGMWNHAAAMGEAMRSGGVARPGFTGEELRHLLAYLRGARSALPATGLYVLPGDPTRGRALFASRSCSRCHSVGGSGGTLGPDLGTQRPYAGVMDFAAAMWNKGPRMIAAMSARSVNVPTLEPSEMADLVAYLRSTRFFRVGGVAERGAAVVRSQKCGRCHGREDGVAPDLRRAAGLGTPEAVVAALWNHVTLREGLPEQWPALSAQEVADVAEYFSRAGSPR